MSNTTTPTKVWALRRNDSGADENAKPAKGVNMFTSKEEAEHALLQLPGSASAMAEVRGFPNPIAARSWITAARKKPAKKEEGNFGDDETMQTWVSPAMRTAAFNTDEPVVLMVEGSCARLQDGRTVAGYEAWVDGTKRVSSALKLPPLTRDRASLYGCYEALMYYLANFTEYAEGKGLTQPVILGTDSEMVWTAVTTTKKVPAKCAVFAKRLRELCHDLPIKIILSSVAFAKAREAAGGNGNGDLGGSNQLDVDLH